jgi:hypothetical protein
MMRPLFIRLGLALFTVMGWCHAQEPARIAVVSDEADANLAALVTTELSSRKDMTLLERDDLAKLGDEVKVQQLAGSDPVALGKLAGADGLLFLDHCDDAIGARFTAVGLGYSVFDDQIPSSEKLSELAKELAHRVAAYATKLRLPVGKAIPLSVLNLRAEVSAPGTAKLERNLTLLLESRLNAVPELVVLERRHAWSLGFEHSLDAPTHPILKGTYLLDGTIATNSAGDVATVALRLRNPHQDKEISTTVTGATNDPVALADKIVAEIVTNLGTPVSPAASNSKEEANEYYDEAIWAWRAGTPDAALEAVDSADLLGCTGTAMQALRIQILCSVANQGMENWQPSFDANNPSFDGDELAKKTDTMLRALQDLALYRAGKYEYHPDDPQPPGGVFWPNPPDLLAEVAFIASKTLQLLDDVQSARADDLRQALREATGYDPLHGNAGVVPTEFLTNNDNAADAFSDDWASTFDEELAWYRLACVDSNPGFPRFALKNPSLSFGRRFLASPAEREAAYESFVETLKDKPGSQLIYILMKMNEADPSTRDQAYRDYLAYLDTHLAGFATADVNPPLAWSLWQLPLTLVQRDAKFALPLVEDILKIKQPGGASLQMLNGLWLPYAMDAGDAPRLWQEFNGYCQRRYTVIKAEQPQYRDGAVILMQVLAQNFRTAFPKVTMASAPVDAGSPAPLLVNRFWSPWLTSSWTGHASFFLLCSHNVAPDELWFGAWVRDPDGTEIFRVHLPDLKTTCLPVPGDQRGVNSLAWTPQALYVPLEDPKMPNFHHELARYDLANGNWTTHELNASFSDVYAVNDSLYLVSGSDFDPASIVHFQTGLLKYDWDADKLTVLAEARRRPAQNQFDDHFPQRISAVFPGPGNQPCVTMETGTFLIKETPGLWPKAFDWFMFAGQVTTTLGESVVYNEFGQMVHIDSRQSAATPWMAPARSIWSLPNGAPRPAPDWADKALWNCPPDHDKGITTATVAFHGKRLFVLAKPSLIVDDYELICYARAGCEPVHIPLSLKLLSADRATIKNSAHLGDDRLDEIEHPRYEDLPTLIATGQGLCLEANRAGFWFIPYSEIDAYLKSQPAFKP